MCVMALWLLFSDLLLPSPGTTAEGPAEPAASFQAWLALLCGGHTDRMDHGRYTHAGLGGTAALLHSTTLNTTTSQHPLSHCLHRLYTARTARPLSRTANTLSCRPTLMRHELCPPRFSLLNTSTCLPAMLVPQQQAPCTRRRRGFMYACAAVNYYRLGCSPVCYRHLVMDINTLGTHRAS